MRSSVSATSRSHRVLRPTPPCGTARRSPCTDRWKQRTVSFTAWRHWRLCGAPKASSGLPLGSAALPQHAGRSWRCRWVRSRSPLSNKLLPRPARPWATTRSATPGPEARSCRLSRPLPMSKRPATHNNSWGRVLPHLLPVTWRFQLCHDSPHELAPMIKRREVYRVASGMVRVPASERLSSRLRGQNGTGSIWYGFRLNRWLANDLGSPMSRGGASDRVFNLQSRVFHYR
jgi:hypothetical protein